MRRKTNFALFAALRQPPDNPIARSKNLLGSARDVETLMLIKSVC